MTISAHARGVNIAQPQVRTWVEDGPGPATLASLVTRVQAAHGRVVEQTTDRLTARFGSRVAYRLFGALLSPGSTHAPMRVVLDLSLAGRSTTVTATASSDPGPYLANTSLGTGLFDAKLPRLLDALSSPSR